MTGCPCTGSRIAFLGIPISYLVLPLCFFPAGFFSTGFLGCDFLAAI